MRSLTLIIGFLIISSCYAFKIASIETFYPVEAHAVNDTSLKLEESVDARLPVKSQASVGTVSQHHLNFKGFANAIFIIGDDAFSKQWLNDHCKQLQKLHAIGFITNINNAQTLDALQTSSSLPLLPANVDDLLMVIATKHYPLIVNKGLVWQ